MWGEAQFFISISIGYKAKIWQEDPGKEDYSGFW